ncbi:mechanosensitive ion channel family protein [Methanoregula sp.]|uniref:mechanosensitive ion channel family protein n=1 Tax=Methanoregula sp. TaxID=2052170 RepID=UPI002CD968A1|nr:mechanosensitive ion channel domain-containing protein [Methanoregula sp.]HVP96282.1 mechanosensitive ion channel domain-containing protein [Methanoregula sp.]
MDNVYTLIVAYLAAGVIAATAIHFFFAFLKRKVELTETKFDDLIVHSLASPVTLLGFFIPFILALQQAIALFPQDSWLADPRLLISLYILIGTWVTATFANDLLQTYGMTLAQKTESELDDRIIEILQKIGRYLIWFIGLMYILSLFNVNITPLLAGAGIAGIAIALAAQDIFSNFFGGAVIITDQPFQVGERVLINDVVGDVIKIGPRSTRILTLDKDIVTIPNTKIVTSVVHNYSQPNPQVRIQIPITVPASVEIARVKKVLGMVTADAVQARSDMLESDPAPTIYLQKVEKSAMTFIVTVYARGFMYDDVIRDYLNVQVVERFKTENIPLL